MKKLLVALAGVTIYAGVMTALFWSPVAKAQCTGLFPPNTICGNLTGASAPPKPFVSSGTGNVVGPGTSVVNDFAVWANTSGTLLSDMTPAQAEQILSFTQTGTGATSRLLDAKIKDSPASIADFGADCTGAAGSDTAITNALAASNTASIPKNCTIKTTTNLTIGQGKALIIPCGSSISPAAATTLTFQGKVLIGGVCQVFGVSHSLPAGTVTGVLDARPEFWGAWNDNSHDDTAIVQATINSVVSTGVSDYPTARIQFPCGSGLFISSTLNVTLPTQRLVDIVGCGIALNSGGIIVHDAATSVHGLSLSGAGTNFRIHDLMIQTSAAGKGACGINLQGVTTNSAAIVSSMIERIQIGTNFPSLGVGFGVGGICMTDVLEVGLRDLTIFLPSAGTGANGIFVTTNAGPSGDMGWDHITVVNCASATTSCINNRPIYLTTTTGACGGNCWTQGIHITHSFLYPYTSVNAFTAFARGTQMVVDVWIDGVQFDDIRAVNGQVIYTPTDVNAEIDNIQVVNSYFTGGGGSQGTAVYYDGGSAGGHTNYFGFSNNYVNLGLMCGNGTPSSAISINAGKSHRITGNMFVMGCSTTSPSGDINIGQGSQKVTSTIVANNISNCAAAGSTSACAGASQFMIATGANAFGVTVYDNSCFWGATSTATGCGVFNGSGLTNHFNNCINNAGNTAAVCN